MVWPLKMRSKSFLRWLRRATSALRFWNLESALAVKGAWVQRALLYHRCIAARERGTPAGPSWSLLEDGATESVISGTQSAGDASAVDLAGQCVAHRSNTLQQVKIAIAQRVLEASGGSVQFYSDSKPGFIIRIPRPQATSAIDELTA